MRGGRRESRAWKVRKRSEEDKSLNDRSPGWGIFIGACSIYSLPTYSKALTLYSGWKGFSYQPSVTVEMLIVAICYHRIAHSCMHMQRVILWHLLATYICFLE